MVSKTKLTVGIALIAATAFTLFRRRGSAAPVIDEEHQDHEN